MKVMSIRDGFRCVVLNNQSKEELELYFQGRQLHYKDSENKEVEYNRQQILNAHRTEGAEYYSLNFEDAAQAHFVLMNAENKVIGSAELYIDEKQSEFSSGHISSEFKGLHLADLLYEAREEYLKVKTDCKRAFLQTKPDNIGSQKAALRNGFYLKESIKRNMLLFEKDLT